MPHYRLFSVRPRSESQETVEGYGNAARAFSTTRKHISAGSLALFRCALMLALDFSKIVGERFARLKRKVVVHHRKIPHPVEPKGAKVFAHFAPSGECPALAPEVQRQRSDTARRVFLFT